MTATPHPFWHASGTPNGAGPRLQRSPPQAREVGRLASKGCPRSCPRHAQVPTWRGAFTHPLSARQTPCASPRSGAHLVRDSGLAPSHQVGGRPRVPSSIGHARTHPGSRRGATAHTVTLAPGRCAPPGFRVRLRCPIEEGTPGPETTHEPQHPRSAHPSERGPGFGPEPLPAPSVSRRLPCRHRQ